MCISHRRTENDVYFTLLDGERCVFHIVGWRAMCISHRRMESDVYFTS